MHYTATYRLSERKQEPVLRMGHDHARRKSLLLLKRICSNIILFYSFLS